MQVSTDIFQALFGWVHWFRLDSSLSLGNAAFFKPSSSCRIPQKAFCILRMCKSVAYFRLLLKLCLKYQHISTTQNMNIWAWHHSSNETLLHCIQPNCVLSKRDHGFLPFSPSTAPKNGAHGDSKVNHFWPWDYSLETGVAPTCQVS